MYGEKMRDGEMSAHGFQHQDFTATLNQAMGRSDNAFLTDICDKYTDSCTNRSVYRAGSMDGKTGAICSESLDIDRELGHLVQNNKAYRSTTDHLLRKMVLFTHAIEQKGY